MIELNHDQLVIHFPEVHEEARLAINFQRTLRIPDDGRTYPLPAGLGPFPLRHVDDHPRTAPQQWIEHGGVMLPMYQAEALWVCFNGSYPFAIKIAAGKINAVTGEDWRDGLHRDPQDYVTAPDQPWLDGYCVKKARSGSSSRRRWARATPRRNRSPGGALWAVCRSSPTQ